MQGRHVRLSPGPELLRQYALVEQHPVAGDDGDAPLAGKPDERCLGPWTVDRVAEHPAFLYVTRWYWHGILCFHP